MAKQKPIKSNDETTKIDHDKDNDGNKKGNKEQEKSLTKCATE